MEWKKELKFLEDNKSWGDAVIFIERATERNPGDVEVYIRAIYLLLNLLLEEDYATHNLEHDRLAMMLKQDFDYSYGKFNGNAEYLFFIGYFMGLAEWYFGQNTLDFSHRMLKRAMEIQPENTLYEWAYKFVSGDESAGHISKKLVSDAEKMHWLKSKGNPGEYMMFAVRSCYENNMKTRQQ